MHLEDTSDVAFAGDWHGNTRWATYCVDELAKQGFRTIVHMGDFGFRFVPGFVRALNTALGRNGMRLYFLRGNHDDTQLLASLPSTEDGTRALSERIRFMPDGFRFHLGNLRVLVLGGAGSIDRAARLPGIEWWDDERLSPALIDPIIEAGGADVILCHDVPTGVQLALNGEFGRYFAERDPGVFEWCNEHRDTLQRIVYEVSPRLVVHGHHHRRMTNSFRGRVRDAVVEGLDCDGTELQWNLAWLEQGVEGPAIVNVDG